MILPLLQVTSLTTTLPILYEWIPADWGDVSLTYHRLSIPDGATMKLTTRGHYSVKALLDLSLQPAESLSSVKAIATRQGLPAPYLEKLLIELRRSQIVSSVRGAQGGYRLARPPAQISLGQILEAVGESSSPLASSLASGAIAADQAEDWVTSMLWQRLHQTLTTAFHRITLEDLYYDARSWQAAQGEGASFVV